MKSGRLLVVIIGIHVLLTGIARGASTIASWNFSRGPQGWITNDNVGGSLTTPEGLIQLVSAGPRPKISMLCPGGTSGGAQPGRPLYTKALVEG